MTMSRHRLFAAIAAAAMSAAAVAAPMQWPDLTDRPRPQASTRLAYAKGDLRYAELWLPKGRGPFPVVLMVHGGCWQTDVADLSIMDWAAEDLRRRGIAVWNIEYRGIDRPGGGYPGTYQDVALAADTLRRLAPLFSLKADKVVVVGHSAGGHLGLWLGARSGIPAGSPLHAARPLAVSSIISLGGLPDLAAQIAEPAGCGAEPAEAMAGPQKATRPDRFRDTSPPAMDAAAPNQILVSGVEDAIAPPSLAAAYAAKMQRKGVKPRLVTIPDEGHVELIAPGSRAWDVVVALIRRELGIEAAE